MASGVGAVRNDQVVGGSLAGAQVPGVEAGRKTVDGTKPIRDAAETADLDAYRAAQRASYAPEADGTPAPAPTAAQTPSAAPTPQAPVREGTSYTPSISETIIRDGKAIGSGAETLIKVARWFGRMWELAATAAEVASPASKFLGRALPILSVPVAAFDIYKAVQVWNDPKSTTEDKVTKTTAAGLSTIAAGAGIVALAFPPAAPIALVVAGVAGVGALIADNWGTVKKWAGAAWDGVKAAGSWVADKAGAAVDVVKNVAGAAVDGVKKVAGAAVEGVKAVGNAVSNVASKAWEGVTSVFSGW